MSQRKTLLKYTKYVMWGTVALIPPAGFFYLLEFYTHNPFAEVRPWAQLFNIVLFELLAGIFLCITGRLRAAYRIEGTAAMIFGLANAYVVRFRTNPLVPWDILSWRTAVSVSGNYDFTPDTRMIVVTILFLALIIGLQPVKFKIGRPGFFKRCLPGVVLGAVLVMFAGTLQQENFQNEHRLYNKLFTPVFMTQVDGIPVTFVMNLAYMSIEKPQKYSVGEAKEFLKKYEKPQETEESIDTILEEEGKDTSDDTSQSGADTGMPNIIVVMNESFSDLSVLGDFKTNEDYMPFLHSLQQGAENTVTGMLNVSVCGGNTADTEYEFLTGNTMAFLPQGSIPYQQYVSGERPSLASYLQSLGYETVATHPYYATGWNRDKVYPWLGFEQSIFKDQYYGARFVRDYVSDASCADKIIQLYEQKEEGRPLFVFNVTMQNHGGYDQTYTNFSPGISVDGVNSISVSQYFSLIKLSDQALEQLIDYFSGVDEKTVIVFFGDHQPSDTVAAPILAMNGMQWNALDEEQQKLRYQVPYVIWANYDIDEEQNADTSANYLGAEVLKRAGVPTDAYQNFLLTLKESYPVISAVRTVEADGSETPAKEEYGEMDIYRKLQYYFMFDWEEESGE